MVEQRTTSDPASSERRYVQLDALRAFAVIAVILQHAIPPLKELFPWGQAGVRLFFVLSGFLITGILMRMRDQADRTGMDAGTGLRRFYMRRFLRILPLYYLVIALALALDIGEISRCWPWLSTFTFNWYIAWRNQWIDGYFHFWTLAVEEQFYLAWPLLVLVAPRRWLAPVSFALVGIGLLYRAVAVILHLPPIATYCLTPACLDTLATGALLAQWIHQPAKANRIARGALLLGLVVVLTTEVLRHRGIGAPSVVFLDSGLGLVFLWLVHGAARGFRGLGGRLLEAPFLIKTGQISYGLYISHVFIPLLLMQVLKPLVEGRGLTLGSSRPLLLAVLITAIVIFPLLSWHFLERPLLDLKRFFPSDPSVSEPPRSLRLVRPLTCYGVVIVALLGCATVRQVRDVLLVRATRQFYAARERDPAVSQITYYVRPSGSDESDGLSPESAWRTLQRANRATFQPGDRLLLEANKRFVGPLHIDTDDHGTQKYPIQIAVFPSGRAAIDAGDGDGIVVENTLGIEIRNLDISGSGLDKNQGCGVRIENDLHGDVRLPSIWITNVTAHGFGQFGILVDGQRGKSGFRDVEIRACNAYDNLQAGIVVQGEFLPLSREYAHRDVRIIDCHAHGNPGQRGSWNAHSGSGIILSDVRRGRIEGCDAFANGRRCESLEGGPVGIWAWDADQIVILRNKSHHNRVNGPKDGGGFDLDGGVTNSIMEDNMSFDNDGPGFMVCQFEGARPTFRNVVRGNLSRNDCRRNSYGALHVWGILRDLEFRDNSVQIGPSPTGKPRAFSVTPNKAWTTDLRVVNNQFIVRGGVPLLEVGTGQTRMILQGNSYTAKGSGGLIHWMGETFHDVADWRLRTGQEPEFGSRGARDLQH